MSAVALCGLWLFTLSPPLAVPPHRFGWAMCALTLAGVALNYSADRSLFHAAVFPETLILPVWQTPEPSRRSAFIELTAVDRTLLGLTLAARLTLIASGLRAPGPATYRKCSSTGTR